MGTCHAARRLTSIEFSFDPCNVYRDGPSGVGYPTQLTHVQLAVAILLVVIKLFIVYNYISSVLNYRHDKTFPHEQVLFANVCDFENCQFSGFDVLKFLKYRRIMSSITMTNNQKYEQ